MTNMTRKEIINYNMKEKYMLFFVYDKEGKKYINTCLGYEELSKFLGRNKTSVQNSIRRIKEGKLTHIRDCNGVSFTVISDKELLQTGGINDERLDRES